MHGIFVKGAKCSADDGGKVGNTARRILFCGNRGVLNGKHKLKAIGKALKASHRRYRAYRMRHDRESLPPNPPKDSVFDFSWKISGTELKKFMTFLILQLKPERKPQKC